MHLMTLPWSWKSERKCHAIQTPLTMRLSISKRGSTILRHAEPPERTAPTLTDLTIATEETAKLDSQKQLQQPNQSRLTKSWNNESQNLRDAVLSRKFRVKTAYRMCQGSRNQHSKVQKGVTITYTSNCLISLQMLETWLYRALLKGISYDCGGRRGSTRDSFHMPIWWDAKTQLSEPVSPSGVLEILF